MHEFGICRNIVDIARSELGKINSGNRRLLAVHVVIGRLRQVVPEYLDFSYNILTKDSDISGSTLVIRSLPIKGKCVQCSWKGEIHDTIFLCRDCGGGVQVIQGNELYLEKLEVEN
jgi:hydrogenase nickel incorporation protein HypA/HybF